MLEQVNKIRIWYLAAASFAAASSFAKVAATLASRSIDVDATGHVLSVVLALLVIVDFVELNSAALLECIAILDCAEMTEDVIATVLRTQTLESTKDRSKDLYLRLDEAEASVIVPAH